MDPTTIDSLSAAVEVMVIGGGPRVVDVLIGLLRRRPGPKASEWRRDVYAIRAKLIKLTPWAVMVFVAIARGAVGLAIGLDPGEEFAAGARTGLAIVGMYEVGRAPAKSRAAPVDVDAGTARDDSDGR